MVGPLLRVLGRGLRSPAVYRGLERLIARLPAGPDAGQLATGSTLNVAWAEAPDGRGAAARLRGPHPYVLTSRAALAVVERVLAGEAPAGFQTPSTAFGPDLVLAIEGVRREDL
jgi:short subunit dehydrogenase-like uncharacterized protein